MSSKENKNEQSYDSITDEVILYKGVMNQKIGKKNIVLSNEISKKKKIINKLFNDRFGKNFIPIKLESLKTFETFIKFFLFSPQSKILSRFPKLKKHFLKEKHINYNDLRQQINCGSLLYLSLSGNGTKLNKNINEKFFQISKNYSTSISKDTISNHIYNVKFLKKNTERINKILSFKGQNIKEIESTNNDNNNNLIKNIENKNDIIKKKKSRNLSNDNFSQSKYTINNIPYNIYDKIFNRNKNESLSSNNKYYTYNNFPSIDNYKTILKKNIKLDKYSSDSFKKNNSRNINSNLIKIEGMTSTMSNLNNDNSSKTFKPYSTISYFNKKNKCNNIFKQTKNFQNDFNKYVQNLNNQTTNCNKKLIRLINGNIKKKFKNNKEENQEVINLKSILIDKNNKKKKRKINNIKQIKGLIKKAKLDIEGEATIDKIKKKELKKFGHYLNEMNNEFALYKVTELFTKAQLKKQGTNFFQEELERLKKKKIREIKVFRSRKNAKNNYLKMIQMKNDLTLIKDKFDKIDNETTHRTMEIKKKSK